MNILIVSHYSIYPPKIGASIAQYGTLEYLSKQYKISLIIPEKFTPDPEELNQLQNLLPQVKIYTFAKQKPNKKEKLNRQNLSLLKEVKHQIKKLLKYFISNFKIRANKSLQHPPQKLISRKKSLEQLYPLNIFSLHEKSLVDKINQIIIKDDIQIVQIEFTENLILVSSLPPSVKKIFVEHECRFQRIESHLKSQNIKNLFGNYIYNVNKAIETAFLNQFDAIFTFSNSDLLFLEQSLGSSINKTINNKPRLFCSPYPILDRDFIKLDRHNFNQPNKLIFVGPEEHFPNLDAVEWFLEETAKEILDKFGLKLYVVGEWSEVTIKKYEDHPSRVKFTGFIKDLYSFAKDSISIAPVRIGGGLRTKILLAMAHGIPVVSTTFALTGINAKHLESVMIADNKEQFCWTVEYLLKDIGRTFRICQNAQNMVSSTYSQSVLADLRSDYYQKILE